MRLTARLILRSNVDWLTEVIRRFSEAYALGLEFSTVSMSNVFRKEKVRERSFIFSPTFSYFCFCGVPVEDHRDTIRRPRMGRR